MERNDHRFLRPIPDSSPSTRTSSSAHFGSGSFQQAMTRFAHDAGYWASYRKGGG